MMIDKKLRLLEPILGTRKTLALRQLFYSEDDFKERKEIESQIDYLISRLVKTNLQPEIMLPPPPQKGNNHGIHIGQIEYLNKSIRPLYLTNNDINRHIGIFGSTGSGKTSFAKHLLKQAHQNNLPFLIIDWEKSYRDLSDLSDDVEIITIGSDVNPIAFDMFDLPAGMEHEEYIKSIIALLAEDFLSGPGSDTMLLHYMKLAYQEHPKPSFNDFKDIVVREINKDLNSRGRLSGRAGLWKETVQRIVSFLAHGATKMTLADAPLISPKDLLGRKVILEFGNVSNPRDRKFLIHLLLNWIFLWLQNKGIQHENLTQLIVFEEFHNIVLKSNEDNLISVLFRQARKYGVGLIAIDQTPSEVPNSIFANINTKISFNLSTNQDITSIANALNLTYEQHPYLNQLRTGQAIIGIKQRDPDPFLIRAPTPSIKNERLITDSELQIKMKHFSSKRSSNQPSLPKTSSSHTSPHIETIPSLIPLEKVLIVEILEKPFVGVDEHTKRLGLHPKDMVKIQKSLSQMGIIKIETIERKKILSLTQEGNQLARSYNLKIPKHNSRGGLEHRYWVHQVFQHLKRNNFLPKTEYKDIDIAVPEQEIFIEIETGKSNIKSNIKKLNALPGKSKFMLATNKIALKTLENMNLSQSIKTITTHSFIKLTRNQILSED